MWCDLGKDIQVWKRVKHKMVCLVKNFGFEILTPSNSEYVRLFINEKLDLKSISLNCHEKFILIIIFYKKVSDYF